MLAMTAAPMTKSMTKSVVVLGCLLWMCGTIPSQSEGVTPQTCSATFSSPNYLVLCHRPPTESKQIYTCPKPSDGFVAKNLVMAPKTDYKECGSFFNNKLLKAQCLREQTSSKDKYDEVIFDILDKVSGQYTVNGSTVVERFPPPLIAPSDGGDVDPDAKGSSAFVAFERQCRPAYPSEEDDTIINMCSNATVRNNRIYLTLRNTTQHKHSIPEQLSMCRCVIRPTKEISVRALDVRLQNVFSPNHGCGKSSLEIKAQNATDSKDVECNGLSALYGFHTVHKSDDQQEFELILKSVNASNFPTFLWIEIEERWDKTHMTVVCEGFIPMPTVTTPGKEDNPRDRGESTGSPDATEGGGDEDNTGDVASSETNIKIIIGAVVGSVVLIIIVVIILLIRRRQRQTLWLTSVVCCKSDNDKDKKAKPYCLVAQSEPVYSEAGIPRPSRSAPYTLPADSRTVDTTIYAEPDPDGKLGPSLPMAPPVPPPLPDSPPPDAPPDMRFAPETPPPKPERTFPRPLKDEAKRRRGGVEEDGGEKVGVGDGEDYDHLTAGGGRGRLKSVPDRDGQNNIIGDVGGGEDESLLETIYNHLDNGTYSQTNVTPKALVKDNVYDTTTTATTNL